MKDGGRGAERDAADGAKRARGQRDIEEVGIDHAHLAESGAQSVGPDRIDLDGDHVGMARGEREREGAGTRANVDDELAGMDPGAADY